MGKGKRAKRRKIEPPLDGYFGHHAPGWAGAPWDAREAGLFADLRGITVEQRSGIRVLRDFLDDDAIFASLLFGEEKGG